VTSFNGNFPKFVYYLFESIGMNRFASGSGVPTLNRNDVHEFYGSVPPTLDEQRKISDCLTSLDELTGAHARALETLRLHKKGLLEQLFPRKGENAPRMRFPEFQDAGDWEWHDLGHKTTKVGSGITPTGGEKTYKKSGRPFIRSQNIGWGELLVEDVAYIDHEIHATFVSTEISDHDVLLNITGASIGRSAVADSRIVGGNVNQHVCIIRPKHEELNPRFLNQFLISHHGQSQIDSFQAGGNRQGLNFSQLRSFRVPMPPKLHEQTRVADCLSSINELITAQTQKINGLKAQKKGLMQQLFPSFAEGL
jgi:type I restriction enzyme S subunit